MPASRSRRFDAGLRTATTVVVATALSIVSLLWASGVARAEVEHRALAGLEATARATVLQQQQAWDDALLVVTSAASRPVPLSAVESRDTALADQGVQNILVTGPFADVRIVDPAGSPVATAALPGVTPSPVGAPAAGTRGPVVGPPVGVGTRTVRPVAVALGSGPGARLIVDVDMTRLLGRPDDLGFGRTGQKFLVTRTGLIVAGSSGVGTALRAARNIDIAAAGAPVTTVLYSPYFGRLTAESFEPVPGQDLGILVQQARSEVMGGADRLAARLRWVALALGALGATLAVSIGFLVSRRARRFATTEERLAESEGESRRRLEQFMDAMPVGVFVADRNGEPYYANPEAERLLGRGIVPGLDRSDLAEIYDVYMAGTQCPYPTEAMPLLRALRGEDSHADDMEIRRADGAIPVEVWGKAVLAGDGSVEFGIAAFADASTRRRAAQEAEFLSAMTANMSEGVVLVRAEDSSIVYANRSYEAMYGYGPGELVGCAITDLTPPDFARSGEVTDIRQALQAHGSWRGEIGGRRKDGGAMSVEVSVTTLDHPTFGAGWIVVNTDVSSRREAQDAQARLASIVQASSEAILAKTFDGVVTSWNPGAERLFGYSAQEMLGSPIDVLIPDAGRAEEAELRSQVARGVQVEQFETVRIRKDGTAVAVSVTLSPMGDADGTISGIATICRDVTEFKRAEAKFHGLLESAPDAIVVVGVDGLIRLVNRQTEVLFGYSRAELVGEPVECLIPNRLAAGHPDLRSSFFANPSVRAMGANLELAARRKDGSEFPVDISLAPLETEEGVLVSAALRDASERKRAEAELLEREEQLAAARDMAVEASRLKSDFLANMSHEIRTPMNAVIGMTGLLLDSPLSAEQYEYAGAVRSAGEALLDIINEILDFSKIEAGKLRLEPVDFEVRSVSEEVADLLGAKAVEKGLVLRTFVDDDVPLLVRGDPGRLRQILTNLVGNAIKFSDRGEIAVWARATPGTPDPGMIRFEVSDGGIGIAPDGQRQLFRAFEQVDSSATRRHGGTGLGLAISKQLVEMMGGKIGVHSVLGAGSTFWFDVKLPSASGPAPAPAMRGGRREAGTSVPAGDAPVGFPGGGARLLVVEDNPVNQLVATRMLEKLGYRADVAANGAEALDALMRIPYAAVLMDCQMPELDGFEATREIRRREHTPRRTPVIAMTAGATSRDRERCFEADMDDYISKPVRMAELGEVLARWVPAGVPST
ncbi:MAG: PAS domain S-box protein [Actinomycetota bacterium]|nr:PAS domain S-box protein [Actinomycetota bacterium]